MSALAAYGVQRNNATPAATVTTPVETKKNCGSIAGTVAAVVGGIALAALAAYAYVKGYLNPVINYSSTLIQSAVSFATKSPLHTVAVVVGGVAVVSLAIFLGKLAYDAINKPKAEQKEEKPADKPVEPTAEKPAEKPVDAAATLATTPAADQAPVTTTTDAADAATTAAAAAAAAAATTAADATAADTTATTTANDGTTKAAA